MRKVSRASARFNEPSERVRAGKHPDHLIPAAANIRCETGRWLAASGFFGDSSGHPFIAAAHIRRPDRAWPYGDVLHTNTATADTIFRPCRRLPDRLRVSDGSADPREVGLLAVARLECVIADEAGLKHLFSCKGSSGLKPYLL